MRPPPSMDVKRTLLEQKSRDQSAHIDRSSGRTSAVRRPADENVQNITVGWRPAADFISRNALASGLTVGKFSSVARLTSRAMRSRIADSSFVRGPFR